MTFSTGSRVLAVLVSFSGTTTEMVRIVRILDQESLLVQVESSLSTPVELRGLTLPIEVKAVVA
jgi:hypothetical protein